MKKQALMVLLIILCTYTYAQPSDSLIKLTDRLYMVAVDGGNRSSFLVTEQGVLVVDAGYNAVDAEMIEKHVKSVTEKPINYLVLTHHHSDHTFGACGFSENPIIIGHVNIVKNIKNSSQRLLDRRLKRLKSRVDELQTQSDSLKQAGDPKWEKVEKDLLSHTMWLEALSKTTIDYPDITFQDKMTLFLGQDTINLIHPGNAHTDCDVLVEFLNQQSLATGDLLFNRCLPYINSKTSDTKNWIEQINYYSEKDYKYVIPGHGKLGTTDDLALQATYLTDLRNEISIRISGNKSLDQIKEEVKMENYSDYDFQSSLSKEIEAVYTELTR